MSGSEVEVPLSKISPAYLHSNSTSHTWAFSAIAELIDNAYDPDVSATELWIDKAMINGKQCLTIEDNGRGLDHGHLLHMLSFGYCEKAEFDHKKTHKPIGKYGNGFKSGSMRLAKDALVFTVCRTSASIGFLSQTYLQETNADSVRVPMIEYSLPGFEIVSEKEKGFLDSILEFSPYSQEKDIRKELENLRKSHTSHTGTKIVLFNLKRHKIGCLELDFDSDAKDIRNPETHVRDLSVEVSKSTQNETSEYLSSLRCYCSILYLKPRMKIYIRGVKVMNTLISESLSSTEKDKYKPSWLDKVLGITFGFVPSKKRHSTDDYGIMFYHRNRLIKAYEKVGYQKQPNDLGVGVVGVVHNADFLTPTHNKQDFVKDEKYNALLSALGQKLNDYWNAKKGQSDQQGTRLSTEEPDWLWVQCDECFKWRRLPDSMKQCELPDKWYCRQNPDPAHNRCDIPEEAHLEGEYTFRCTYTKAKPQSVKKRGKKESAEVEEKKAEVEAKAAELAARVAELEETQRKRARLNVEPRAYAQVLQPQMLNSPAGKATKRMSSEEMPLAEKRRSVENETRNTSMVSALPSSSSAGTPGQKTDIRPVDLSNKPVVTLTVDADRVRRASGATGTAPLPPLGIVSGILAGRGASANSPACTPTVTRTGISPGVQVTGSPSGFQSVGPGQRKLPASCPSAAVPNRADLDVDHVLDQLDHAIGGFPAQQHQQHGSVSQEETAYTLLKQKYTVLQQRCERMEEEFSRVRQRHLAFKRDVHSLLSYTIKGLNCGQEEIEAVVKDLILDNTGQGNTTQNTK